MRRCARRQTVALLGTAEEIRLIINGVNAVLVAQAHWTACPEVALVLRPGGRLAWWEHPADERLGWVRELGEIIVATAIRRGQGDVVFGAVHYGAKRHQVER